MLVSLSHFLYFMSLSECVPLCFGLYTSIWMSWRADIPVGGLAVQCCDWMLSVQALLLIPSQASVAGRVSMVTALAILSENQTSSSVTNMCGLGVPQSPPLQYLEMPEPMRACSWWPRESHGSLTTITRVPSWSWNGPHGPSEELLQSTSGEHNINNIIRLISASMQNGLLFNNNKVGKVQCTVQCWE